MAPFTFTPLLVIVFVLPLAFFLLLSRTPLSGYGKKRGTRQVQGFIFHHFFFFLPRTNLLFNLPTQRKRRRGRKIFFSFFLDSNVLLMLPRFFEEIAESPYF